MLPTIGKSDTISNGALMLVTLTLELASKSGCKSTTPLSLTQWAITLANSSNLSPTKPALLNVEVDATIDGNNKVKADAK